MEMVQLQIADATSAGVHIGGKFIDPAVEIARLVETNEKQQQLIDDLRSRVVELERGVRMRK